MRKRITETVRKAIGAAIQMAFFFGEAVMEKLGWRAKIKAKFGRDPMRCDECGREMILWKIWTPGYGTLFYLPDCKPESMEIKLPLKEEVSAQLNFAF